MRIQAHKLMLKAKRKLRPVDCVEYSLLHAECVVAKEKSTHASALSALCLPASHEML